MKTTIEESIEQVKQSIENTEELFRQYEPDEQERGWLEALRDAATRLEKLKELGNKSLTSVFENTEQFYDNVKKLL